MAKLSTGQCLSKHLRLGLSPLFLLTPDAQSLMKFDELLRGICIPGN
jgi:hypothetical protein